MNIRNKSGIAGVWLHKVNKSGIEVYQTAVYGDGKKKQNCGRLEVCVTWREEMLKNKI